MLNGIRNHKNKIKKESFFFYFRDVFPIIKMLLLSYRNRLIGVINDKKCLDSV